jgi:hypothetical protein
MCRNSLLINCSSNDEMNTKSLNNKLTRQERWDKLEKLRTQAQKEMMFEEAEEFMKKVLVFIEMNQST